MVELRFSAVTVISSRPVSAVTSVVGAAVTGDSKLPNTMRLDNITRKSRATARTKPGCEGELDIESNFFNCISTVSQCSLRRQGVHIPTGPRCPPARLTRLDRTSPLIELLLL